jgi:5-methyltetrahydropteroyltriglutamate--homocysteine methyltransferase
VLQAFTDKTIILGVLDLGDQGVESPETVAGIIREALRYVPPERLQVAPDCGMKCLPRETAFRKLQVMTLGAGIVRDALGLH